MMGRTYRKRTKTKNKQKKSCLSNDLIQLLQWLKIKIADKLTPATFTETGRGLMTKRPITPGDIIISIPKQFLITMETVLQSDVGEWLKRSSIKLNLQQAMSIFLIKENKKHHNSVWSPYIQVLPRTYDTPAFWTFTDLNLLPRHILSKIIGAIDDLGTSYDEIVNFLSSCCDFIITFEEFRWAWYCINSRSVYYDNNGTPYISDKCSNIALAPFLDLLNHSTSAVIEAGFNKKSNCYEIKSHNKYKKYDQVFISYGPHSNTHLLMEYGFILPNNPHDVYEIEFDTILRVAESLNIHNIEKKSTIITENDLNKKLVCTMEGISWNLQTVLKLLAMDFTELKSWKMIFNGDFISLNNDQAAKHIAQVILQDKLLSVTAGFDKFPSKDYIKLTLHQRMAYDLLKIEHNILRQSIKLL